MPPKSKKRVADTTGRQLRGTKRSVTENNDIYIYTQPPNKNSKKNDNRDVTNSTKTKTNGKNRKSTDATKTKSSSRTSSTACSGADDHQTDISNLVQTVSVLSDNQKELEKQLAAKDQIIAASTQVLIELKTSIDTMNTRLDNIQNPTATREGTGPVTEQSQTTPIVITGAEQAPWPNMDTVLGKRIHSEIHKNISDLPPGTRERVSTHASSSLPIYAHVSEKIRQKIWANEFVDMAILSPSRGFSNPTEYAFLSTVEQEHEEDGRVSKLAVISQNKPKKLTHSQWDLCFEIFQAIYTANPNLQHEGTALCAYRGNVRQLANCGADWVAFDESFRSLRVSMGWTWDHKPGNIMWSVTLPALCKPQSQPFRSQGEGGKFGKRKSSAPITKGLCYKFNSFDGSKCQHGEKCRYRHACRWCDGVHAASKCPSGQSAKNSALTHKRKNHRD